MKQMIVLIAMIALGIAIAGFIMGFSTQTKALAQDAGKTITYTNIATP